MESLVWVSSGSVQSETYVIYVSGTSQQNVSAEQIQMCSPRMADANSTFCQFKIGLFLFPYLPIPCIMFFRGLIQSTAAYLFIVSLLVDLKIEFENLAVLKLI